MESLDFVQETFRNYYQENSLADCSVTMLDRREFGFATFEGRMIRHKGFSNGKELMVAIQDLVPRDAYVSCAYYETPEAEMERKGWLGADLIFDIDADHIPTSCGKVHDEWTCVSCNFVGKGLVPEKCPICGSQKFDVKTWPCEDCLKSAKNETAKVIDMLLKDFGFSAQDVHVFFSGHRGYHIHVENDAVKTLDSISRKEIVDYVCGLGLDADFYGLSGKTLGKNRLEDKPALSGSSWTRRVGKSVYAFILSAEREGYKTLGLKRNVVEKIINNKNAILQDWNHGIPYKTVKGIGSETWQRIIDHCIDSVSAKIDTVVTTDTHRLIRLADTLHGKTGFKKVEFPLSQIEDFDPFKSAVAFKKGTVTILVSDGPTFRLEDEVFGPYRNQEVELPTAAAVFLVCKGRAKVLGQKCTTNYTRSGKES